MGGPDPTPPQPTRGRRAVDAAGSTIRPGGHQRQITAVDRSAPVPIGRRIAERVASVAAECSSEEGQGIREGGVIVAGVTDVVSVFVARAGFERRGAVVASVARHAVVVDIDPVREDGGAVRVNVIAVDSNARQRSG